MIIVVTGLGRSGTSLMMRMLHHGGVPVFTGPDPVTYECAYSVQLPQNYAWIKEAEGAAVKIMDPIRNPPPPVSKFPSSWQIQGDTIYKFIWMSRNFDQQSKSFVKLQKKQGLPATRAHARTYAKQFRDETRQSILKLSEYKCPLLRVNFEDLILNPFHQAERVLQFLQPDFNPSPSKMASQLIERHPNNYDGFLEEQYDKNKSSMFK